MIKIFQSLRKLWKLFSLLLLIFITFSYAMFQGGFVSWFLFYSFLPFALYALYVVLFPLQSFTAEREFSKWEYFAHDDITVTITIKRNHAFPLLFIIIEDDLSPTIQKSVHHHSNKTIYFLGFQREFSFQYRMRNLPRGEHEFRNIVVRIGDLLGIIEKEKYILTDEKILVFPSFKEYIQVSANQLLQQSIQLTKGHLQSDSSMVVGIREYQPGDRLSWINWKASARRNGMVTKEFETGQSTDVLLVMDSTPSPQFENLVSFTASLGQVLLYKGTKVGFLSVSEETISMPIHGGEYSRQQLFFHLAKIQDRSPIAFHEAIVKERIMMDQKAALFLLTSHLTEQLIEAASKISLGKKPVVIIVMESENSSAAPSQQALKQLARSYRIVVSFIHNGPFQAETMEVGSLE